MRSQQTLVTVLELAVVAACASASVACRKPDATALIASAASKHRHTHVRIPGAAYTTVHTTRGAAEREDPAELSKAELLILRERAARGDEPSLLLLQSRVQLLRGKFNEAVATAHGAGEPSSSGALDLANAYLSRALGTSNARDLQFAIEHYGQAVAANPRDLVARFNRGIALEHLFLYRRAVEDYEIVAAHDPDGGWAVDARNRAARLQADTRTWQEALASLDGRGPRNEVPAEVILDSGLDRLLSEFANEDPQRSHGARNLLLELARELARRHDDHWLSDLMNRSHTDREALGVLGSAIRDGRAGNRAAALAMSARANRIFEQQGNKPGALRARLEDVYAHSRSFRTAECLTKADGLARALEGQRYTWISAQLAIERSICEFHQGSFDSAMERIRNITEALRSSGLQTLELRALGVEASFHRILGDSSRTARTSLDGLSLFWRGRFPPARAFHFLGELFLNAERENCWRAAEMIAREAVDIVVMGTNRLTEASARMRLASISLRTNNFEVAVKQGRIAAQQFAAFGDDPSNREFVLTNAVALADAYLAAGNIAEAQRVLTDYEGLTAQTVYSRIGLQRVLGLTLDRAGEKKRALLALHDATRLAERSTESLRDASTRQRWKQEAGPAFRALARLLLDENRPEEALAVWEWFRSAPIRRGAVPPLANAAGALRSALEQFTDQTVVSWLELDGRFGVWLYDDRGVRFFWSSASAQACRRAASEFARLCSRQRSDLQRLKSVAADLYLMLLGPVDHLLDSRRILVLEPDHLPGVIAFEALVRPGGQWLADLFQIAIGPGLWADLALRREQKPLSRNMQALIIGNPLQESSIPLPSLPDAEREASFISRLLPSNSFLGGARATATAVHSALPRTEVFHFAGHARFDGESVRLLLAGENALLDTNIVEKSAARCRLAVLSACSTGALEMHNPWIVDSLVQSFWRAGSPRVVASRWDVDSTAAAELITSFYTHAFSGEPATQSLWKAAHLLRSRSETSHPYFWAAFALFGSATL